jgi:ferredoxin--NADP+ reductase
LNRILRKEVLSPSVKLMEIDAPRIAKKTQPGQFIILRVNETGERIPLTVADFDREKGSVTIVFQEVGKTTKLLGALNEGDEILDFAGPLGQPSHLEGYKRVCVVGGGLGCAIAYPQAKALYEMGAKVDIIAGFRSQDLIFFEKEMAACSDDLIVCTDDGSNGNKGLVTEFLKKKIDEGAGYDLVVAIGPPIMMKFVSLTTKPYGIKTIVSMNPIMIDGTGMCGGCRVSVGGKIRFACVDGPDFDGHEVDFDEMMRRSGMYRETEQEKLKDHICRLEGGNANA